MSRNWGADPADERFWPLGEKFSRDEQSGSIAESKSVKIKSKAVSSGKPDWNQLSLLLNGDPQEGPAPGPVGDHSSARQKSRTDAGGKYEEMLIG
jgi:hypothetical protein